MTTRIESMRKMLDNLHTEKNFDELFDYALYLANELMFSDKVGRSNDKVIDKMLKPKQCAKYYRSVLSEINKSDEFTQETLDFKQYFNGLINSEVNGNGTDRKNKN